MNWIVSFEDKVVSLSYFPWDTQSIPLTGKFYFILLYHRRQKEKKNQYIYFIESRQYLKLVQVDFEGTSYRNPYYVNSLPYTLHINNENMEKIFFRNKNIKRLMQKMKVYTS